MSQPKPADGMLQVRLLTGDLVLQVADPWPVEEHAGVVSMIKKLIRDKIAISTFRQQLVCDSSIVSDDTSWTSLGKPLHLNLVVIQQETTNEHQKLMLQAAVNGDLDMMLPAIRSGQDPDSVDRFCRSAAWHAAAAARQCTKAFCDNVFSWDSPHVRTVLQTGDLHNKEGHVHVLDVLYDACANIELGGLHDETPLHSASMAGHADVVQFLLSKRAGIDRRSRDGRSALYVAVEHQRLEVVDCLLRSAADVNTRRDRERTALMCAVEAGHLGIADLLLSSDADPQLLFSGWTALSFAAQRGHLELVRRLLDGSVRPDAGTHDRWSPLFLAVSTGHSDVARLLIERSADLDRQDDDGWTPLLLAAGEGDYELVELLVNATANPHHASDSGVTPLSLAAQRNHPRVRRFLADATLPREGEVPMELERRDSDISDDRTSSDSATDTQCKKEPQLRGAYCRLTPSCHVHHLMPAE
ncbi:ANK1 [Symbiodinium necroappetens]|uniref:ANK1 protein n=1 Tax=Symbiodinium necroappetens TaxID=1628268 RepID=A0A813CL87_9DINO|nr:ANK1 [Symbiodinium necroappetens]